MDGARPAKPRRRAGRPPAPEKRCAILAAARDLFLAEGYGVSMDRVAERAGVSKQTIYTHFAGKEPLFQAIVRSHCERITEPLAGTRDGRPPCEVLAAMGLRLLELMSLTDYGRLLRTLAATAAQFPDTGRDFYEAGPLHSHGALAGYLAELDRRGVLRVPDPGLAAEQFFGMVNGHTQLRALIGIGAPLTEEQRRHRVAAAVRVFLAAYGA
ncbi:TetR/AcrR family transcriptional regulator [Azospirillum sp. ST 5-10]|uniref:TetR/AcrR family transcriptional regulator n=1 Tax=unclassified Azospirillum TaxID=2630922 RepID=UPI003F4A1302